MAYDEFQADRVRHILRDKDYAWEEKKMMGGLCFMVDDKMLIGVESERLMVRIGGEAAPKALKKKHCIPMDFTGRPMKAFVWVNGPGYDKDKDLEHWVQLALEFNPLAKSSKKKKKK